MNSRVIAIVVGLITLALGFAGLSYPVRVMGVLGLSILEPSHAAAVLGEVRATYGGLFAVMGVYTLLAALDPVAHRARFVFIGLLWLGAGAGRLASVWLDGNPGLPGWVAVVFEALMGGALVAAAVIKPRTTATVSTSFQPSTPPPQP